MAASNANVLVSFITVGQVYIEYTKKNWGVEQPVLRKIKIDLLKKITYLVFCCFAVLLRQGNLLNVKISYRKIAPVLKNISSGCFFTLPIFSHHFSKLDPPHAVRRKWFCNSDVVSFDENASR